jgi:L-asparaginase II
MDLKKVRESIPRGAEPAAIIYRGSVVEATHYASIAVVNDSGKVTHYLGDPEQVTMTRSSIKPFQLIPLVVSGAADEFGYSNPNLSIMAGSHSGTDEHIRVVAANLKRAGNDASHLKCGHHWPLGMQTENKYPLKGEDRDPLRHNCSGKHSGFLALARYLGVEPAKYLEPESQVQRLVKSAVSEVCEYPEELMYLGTDGCSAPNFPLPIRNLARGFMKLAGHGSADDRTARALARIREAMSEFPLLFSGENRFDYNLMQSFPWRAVCKGGAEALQAIGFVEPRIGIVVKVHDGNARGLGVICLEVLRQLGIVQNMDDFPHLKRYDMPEVKNNAGLVTGHVVPTFKLKSI